MMAIEFNFFSFVLGFLSGVVVMAILSLWAILKAAPKDPGKTILRMFGRD